MTSTHGFELIREVELLELKGLARQYRHVKTGAEVMSVINDDENKAFCIMFRTPSTDSTGIAHILEHCVRSGSRKFPLKKPLTEMAKGSLSAYDNAQTGRAETYYQAASLNERGFYNLVDANLDAVFFPHLTLQTFQQEGWRYELSENSGSLIYKGVVLNEMKGALQSLGKILYVEDKRSLFPDHPYAVNGDGDPKIIPDLTWEMLDAFHKKYYHPSNASICFWGNDNPEERLRILDSYFSLFDARPADFSIPLVPGFSAPKRLTVPYAVSSETAPKAVLSMNWVLTNVIDYEFDLSINMLTHILTGTPASLLRKAIIDSGLVENVSAGISPIRQRVFHLGMKGMALEDAGRVEKLVFDALASLADNGVDPNAIEAAVNTVEFALREMNTGNFPRGLSAAFFVLRAFLFDADPFQSLHFESPLASIKTGIAKGGYFEKIIRTVFLENNHRSTITLVPDPGLAEREAEEEHKKLATIRVSMNDPDLDRVIAEAKYLKKFHQTPESEEALATLPRLTLQDLDPKVKIVPTEKRTVSGALTYYHDIITNGIVYIDCGFDLRVLPQELLPYLPLFFRSLLQMGTSKEDAVKLNQRIGRKTGGIWQEIVVSSAYGTKDAIGRLFLRSKATTNQAADLLAILGDVILMGRMDDAERFKQMAFEERARLESNLAATDLMHAVHRLKSRFSQAGWVGEQIGGMTYVDFIRDLSNRIVTDWPAVQSKLEEIKSLLLNRSSMIVNVTVDKVAYNAFEPQLAVLMASIPATVVEPKTWNSSVERVPEAFATPGKINTVGKSVNLCDFGYEVEGSALVASNLLNTAWLYEKVRMEGGAYGVFSELDHITGEFSLISYHDPNLQQTLDNFDGSANYLRGLKLSEAELIRAIIGSINELDAYQLPDAKGWSAMLRDLVGDTGAKRQLLRDQVLSTTLKDLHAFGDTLAAALPTGQICIVGATDAIEKANAARPGWLKVRRML